MKLSLLSTSFTSVQRWYWKISGANSADITRTLAAAQGNKGMFPHPLSHPLLLPEHSSSADCPKRAVRMILPSEVGLKAATNTSVFSKMHAPITPAAQPSLPWASSQSSYPWNHLHAPVPNTAVGRDTNRGCTTSNIPVLWSGRGTSISHLCQFSFLLFNFFFSSNSYLCTYCSLYFRILFQLAKNSTNDRA